MRTAFAINAAQRAGQGTALEHNAQQSGGYHSFKPVKKITVEEVRAQWKASAEFGWSYISKRKRHG